MVRLSARIIKEGGMEELSMVELVIDRTQPFISAELFEFDRLIIEEQDERSLALKHIDIAKIQLRNVCRPGESYIYGEERIARFKKTGFIRLDAKVLKALLQNKALIPEGWNQKKNGINPCIAFDGTILHREYEKGRCVLALCWNGKKWNPAMGWLSNNWGGNSPSAVLINI